MEYKHASFEAKAAPDGDGRFEGYASVFGNVDGGMDVVQKGAFTKSLATRTPKMLWQHDPHQIIGVWEAVSEDDRGLFVKGRLFAEIERGRDALTLLREGALDSMSIGYRTIEAAPEGRVRKLKEVSLFEVSLVTFAMNELATVTAVKSIRTEREFEAWLRDAGYSRKEAAAITLHGFKGLNRQRDAEPDAAEPGDLKAVLAQFTELRSIING